MNQNVRNFAPVQQLYRFLLGVLLTLLAFSALSQQESKVLRSSWYQWDPYQYEIVKRTQAFDGFGRAVAQDRLWHNGC